MVSCFILFHGSFLEREGSLERLHIKVEHLEYLMKSDTS